MLLKRVEQNVCRVCDGPWRGVCGQLEDAEERAKQEAAKNFVGTSTAPARYDTTANNDQQDLSDAEDVCSPN